MKRLAFAVAGLLAVTSFAATTAEAQVRRGAAQGERGIAAGQIHDRQGPNGSRVVGGRGVVADGNGNAAAGAVNCARTPNAQGCRAGATTRTADGAVNHRSGFAVEGDAGSATSQGGFTKSADGTIDQGRTTTATGQNGSVTVDGAYNSDTGRTRTVTCSDSSGAIVACPRN